MKHRRALLLGLGLAFTLAPSSARAYGFDDAEDAFQFTYLSTAIAIHGRVVNEYGRALEGAQIELIGWGEGIINDGEAAMSWAEGGFDIDGLARRNVLLEVRLDGYYPEIIPVELQRPIDEDTVELGDIQLVAEQVGRARLSFAGDAMFGRRMFDHGQLAQPTLAADTEALFRHIEPLLWADDHTTINLETPVTDNLLTPHPSKSFVFNAYPASAAALPGVGIDSVSLGNNHVYDYMAVGLIDTIANLTDADLPFYGAGLDESDAAARVLRPTIRGLELSLQGFSAISGASYGAKSLDLIAHDKPSKPGALHASTEQIAKFIDGEVAKGRAAIPVFHGGDEYVEAQTPDLRADMFEAVARGAALVIVNHPHVVHGVQLIDGPDGPRFVFGSLGNFVFDQEIYETFRSYLAVVDITDKGKGPVVDRVRLVPMVRDDYAPRLLVGDALAKFGRHVAGLTTTEAEQSGFRPAIVFVEGGKLVVAADASGLSVTDLLDSRELALVGGRTGVLELDPYTQTDALAALRSETAATCELGRDRLAIGGFEEPDVDERALEGDNWTLSFDRYIEGVDTHSGAGAAVLLRHAAQPTPAKLSMIRKVALTPGRRMTIHGWHKAVNAGKVSVEVRWVREDGSTISTTTAYQNLAGEFDWTGFDADLQIPAKAAAMQVDFLLDSPNKGEGRLLLDDLAFIEWSPKKLAVDDRGVEIASPNAWEYLRCEAAGKSLALTLTHRTYASRRRVFVSRIKGLPTKIRPRSL